MIKSVIKSVVKDVAKSTVKAMGISLSTYWMTRTVTGVVVRAKSNTELRVSWLLSGILDYTGHKIYVSSDGGVTYNLNKTIASIGIGATLTGLSENTLYYVKVAPYKLTNIGTLSDAGSDTTFLTALWDGNTVGLYDSSRAYSFTRESDLWALQGTILEATEAHETDNVYEPTVIFEGDAQIIATTDPVFKMWYTGGWGTMGLCYAESPTGLPGTWVKYGTNPIIATTHCTYVMRVGATYWCYGNNAANTGWNLWTSPDGITWTLDTANVLLKGGVGAWDAGGVGNIFVHVENGTWYAYYDAYIIATPTWKLGLATSPDGKTWTKQGTGPLLDYNGMNSHGHIEKIGSLFYLWCHGGNLGGLPTDIIQRFRSIDLINWVQDTDDFTLCRRLADEGCSTVAALILGQLADVCLLEVNSQVYMFYSASANGNLQTGELHIKLAIADMPFIELVTDQSAHLLDTIIIQHDLSGNCNHLYGGLVNTLPSLSADGVLCDGSNDTLATKQITLNQPATNYIVVRQKSWTLYRTIIDGRLTNTMSIQQNATTPKVLAYAGGSGSGQFSLTLNVWGLLSVIFYGANSKTQLNDEAVSTVNVGTASPQGLRLASICPNDVGPPGNHGNIEEAEWIVRKIAEVDTTAIKAYLKAKWALSY